MDSAPIPQGISSLPPMPALVEQTKQELEKNVQKIPMPSEKNSPKNPMPSEKNTENQGKFPENHVKFPEISVKNVLFGLGGLFLGMNLFNSSSPSHSNYNPIFF